MNWSSVGRTTSLWQQTAEQKDLQWPLTPGASTSGPKVGKSWKLSSTMTTRRPLGQHDDLTLTLHCHFLKVQILSGESAITYLLCADCPSRVRGAVGPSVWRRLTTSPWRAAVSWWASVTLHTINTHSQNRCSHRFDLLWEGTIFFFALKCPSPFTEWKY